MPKRLRYQMTKTATGGVLRKILIVKILQYYRVEDFTDMDQDTY